MSTRTFDVSAPIVYTPPIRSAAGVPSGAPTPTEIPFAIDTTSTRSSTTGAAPHGPTGGGASALDDLTDVSAGTPSNGDVLQWSSSGSAWISTAVASSGIAETLLDAKGDLIVASAADTPARLAVGTDGYVLVADAASTNGIKWATAASLFPGAGAASSARLHDRRVSADHCQAGRDDGRRPSALGRPDHEQHPAGCRPGRFGLDEHPLLRHLVQRVRVAWYKFASSEGTAWTMTHGAGDDTVAALVVFRGPTAYYNSAYAVDSLTAPRPARRSDRLPRLRLVQHHRGNPGNGLRVASRRPDECHLRPQCHVYEQAADPHRLPQHGADAAPAFTATGGVTAYNTPNIIFKK